MKSLFRATACLSVCWLTVAAAGCGGGSSPAASAPAASSPPPAAASLPGEPGGGEAAAADPAPLPESDGSGAAMPGDPAFAGGMPGPGMGDPAMTPDGMMPGMPGMGMNEGMAGMPGMPGMGMPGMGMPGMGMNGQRGPVDPSPSEDDDSLTKAKYAFSIGKEQAAEQYLYAHILTNDADAAGLLQQIRWSPAGKKPTSTLRFAVGVELKAPPNVTDYQPIGRTPIARQANQGGGGGAGGAEMGMGSGMPGGAGGQGTQKSFGDLTGRFGEELMKSFETAWDAGTYGTVFKEVETAEPFRMGAPGMNGMNGMMGGMPGGFGMEAGMAGEGMGMPGQNGQPGAAAPDVTPRLRALPGKVIVPGLLFLGTGSLSELVGKAETEGVDFVFIFDVEVKITRFITNETRLRLVSAKDQANIAATSTLKSLTVDKDVARGEKDEVVKQLGNVFKKLDAYKLTDMPKLQPVHAQARIKSLIEKNNKDQLGTLMEIKLFHSLGLLNDEERDAAYQLVIGGNGIAFSTGTVEDREFVLKPLLPAYK